MAVRSVSVARAFSGRSIERPYAAGRSAELIAVAARVHRHDCASWLCCQGAHQAFC